MSNKKEQPWVLSPVSAIVANMYMKHFEELALQTASERPRVWKRYVDDTCCIISFKEQLKIVRRLLTPPGYMSLDNFGLMESMFDIIEREVQEESMDSTSSEEQHLKSFMRDSGKILFKLIVSLPVSSNIQQEFTLETPIQTTSSFL